MINSHATQHAKFARDLDVRIISNIRWNVRLPPFQRSIDVGKVGLDAERSMLYCDLVLSSLTEAAREALQTMNASKYEYQSEFARRYYGKGKTEGRVELVLKQLATKYGYVPLAMAARVRDASGADVDEIARRVLTADTLDEALGLTCA